MLTAQTLVQACQRADVQGTADTKPGASKVHCGRRVGASAMADGSFGSEAFMLLTASTQEVSGEGLLLGWGKAQRQGTGVCLGVWAPLHVL